MPQMDGFTFLKEKNKSIYNNGIPVLIITSMNDEETMKKAMNLGVADFLYKPLDPKVTRIRVNNVLSNYGIGYAYNDNLQREFLDLINHQIKGGTLCVYADKDLTIQYVSESLANLLGYQHSHELTTTLNNHWINIYEEKEKHTILKRLNTNKTTNEFLYEIKAQKKDGTFIWLQQNGKISNDTHDKKKFVILCMDISATKEIQEELSYNEKLANIAMGMSGISLWEYDIKSHNIIQTDNSIQAHGFHKIIPDVPQSLVDIGFIHPDYIKSYLKMHKELEKGAPYVSGIFKVQTKDRKSFYYERIRYTNIFDANGKPYRAIGASDNVTEHEEMMLRYQREVEFNRAQSPNVFATVLLNITERKVEEAHTDLEDDEQFFQTLNTYDCINFAKDLPFISSTAARYFSLLTRESIIDSYAEGMRTFTYEFVKIIQGKQTWIQFEAHLTKDPKNDELLAFIYFENIDEKHKEVERLRNLAQLDQMTRVYNHDTALKKTENTLNDGRNMNHAFFMIDVNKFKQINDVYGHINGDKVLKTVAQNIKNNFRLDDIIGRVGGDEFIILMKNVPSLEIVKNKCDELAHSLSFACMVDHKKVNISCSIGVSIAHGGKNIRMKQLYEMADSAMYRVKKNPLLSYYIANEL